MGRDWAPVYGELELGSALETAEKVISKIKSNKFDNVDLKELYKVLTAIREEVAKNEK